MRLIIRIEDHESCYGCGGRLWINVCVAFVPPDIGQKFFHRRCAKSYGKAVDRAAAMRSSR